MVFGLLTPTLPDRLRYPKSVPEAIIECLGKADLLCSDLPMSHTSGFIWIAGWMPRPLDSYPSSVITVGCACDPKVLRAPGRYRSSCYCCTFCYRYMLLYAAVCCYMLLIPVCCRANLCLHDGLPSWRLEAERKCEEVQPRMTTSVTVTKPWIGGVSFSEVSRVSRVALTGVAVQVKGWVMSRYRRRDWVDRDWVAWYYRDRERQVIRRMEHPIGTHFEIKRCSLAGRQGLIFSAIANRDRCISAIHTLILFLFWSFWASSVSTW